MGRPGVLAATLLALSCVAFALHALNVSYAPPVKDGRQNVTFAYNLARHATFARSLREPPGPSNYREPLWPALLALGMRLHPGIDVARDGGPCLARGEPACRAAVSQLKLLNVLLLLLAANLAGWSVFRLTGRVLPAALCFVCVAFSLRMGIEVNRFYSEVVAAAVLTALSAALLRASAPGAPGWVAALAGALAGLLALTKAIFQPLPVVLLAAFVVLWARRGLAAVAVARRAVLVALAAALVLGPWMVRNQAQFGSPGVAARRYVLLYRANLSDATWRQLGLAFLYYLPDARLVRPLRDRLVSEDEMTLLDKHHPQGYYERARRRFDELKHESRAGWDHRARAEALEKIRADPVKYVALCLPLAWGGMFDDRGFGLEHGRGADGHLSDDLLGRPPPVLAILEGSPDGDLLISLGLFAAFGGCLGFGLLRRRADLLLFLLPGVYSVAVHVVYSHGASRFAVPLVPVLWACAWVVAVAVFERATGRPRSAAARPG